MGQLCEKGDCQDVMVMCLTASGNRLKRPQEGSLPWKAILERVTEYQKEKYVRKLSAKSLVEQAIGQALQGGRRVP